MLDVHDAQDQETKDVIQWCQYVPERAKAAYCVPIDDIDLTRGDYAIFSVRAERSRTRTKHPRFVPIGFAKHVINKSKQANGTCLFPCHESRWKQFTQFPKRERKVRFVSNFLWKRFVDIAQETTVPNAQSVFLRGDKMRLAQEGIHPSVTYGRGLRFVERLCRNYPSSKLACVATNPAAENNQTREQVL